MKTPRRSCRTDAAHSDKAEKVRLCSHRQKDCPQSRKQCLFLNDLPTAILLKILGKTSVGEQMRLRRVNRHFYALVPLAIERLDMLDDAEFLAKYYSNKFLLGSRKRRHPAGGDSRRQSINPGNVKLKAVRNIVKYVSQEQTIRAFHGYRVCLISLKRFLDCVSKRWDTAREGYGYDEFDQWKTTIHEMGGGKQLDNFVENCLLTKPWNHLKTFHYPLNLKYSQTLEWNSVILENVIDLKLEIFSADFIQYFPQLRKLSVRDLTPVCLTPELEWRLEELQLLEIRRPVNFSFEPITFFLSIAQWITGFNIVAPLVLSAKSVPNVELFLDKAVKLSDLGLSFMSSGCFVMVSHVFASPTFPSLTKLLLNMVFCDKDFEKTLSCNCFVNLKTFICFNRAASLEFLQTWQKLEYLELRSLTSYDDLKFIHPCAPLSLLVVGSVYADVYCTRKTRIITGILEFIIRERNFPLEILALGVLNKDPFSFPSDQVEMYLKQNLGKLRGLSLNHVSSAAPSLFQPGCFFDIGAHFPEGRFLKWFSVKSVTVREDLLPEEMQAAVCSFVNARAHWRSEHAAKWGRYCARNLDTELRLDNAGTNVLKQKFRKISAHRLYNAGIKLH